MSTPPKSPKPPAPESSGSETTYPAEFADLFLKGVQRAADMQKKSLDTAVQQNADAIETYKNASKSVPAAPGIFDLVGQAFGRYVEAQKNVIDEMVQHTASMLHTAKEGSSSAAKVAEDFTKVIQQSIERTVSVQKKALDLAAQQTKNASQTAKQHFSGTPMETAVDSFQRGVDAAVESHKDLLDAASKPLKPKP